MSGTGVCPRMSSGQQGIVNCKGEKCAWWNKEYGVCIEVLKACNTEQIKQCLVSIVVQLMKIAAGGDEDGT